MPMVISDPRQRDNPIVLANKAFLDLTGYSAEEVIGRNCRFLQGHGTSPEAVEQIRQALREERDFEIEILNYRKDGSAFWNQLSISPVHDDEGNLRYVFASQIDVTDFRKIQILEASEHRLLAEVDHRAKNALAVVNSIVRLSRAEDAGHYAKSIQQRVQVLAQAHNLLAKRGWQEVPFHEIIQEQLGDFDPARVSLDGVAISIPALIVQPMALVVHELADNAAKHGALSVPDGKLEVTWAEGSDKGGFELCWRETGGPSQPADARKGFGGAMIAGTIEHQLHGRVERESIPDGLVVRIRVPSQIETAGQQGEAEQSAG